MVHAYCQIRDSWTGWLRGDAMSRTLYERIVPEMRALRDAERHIVDTPSVTLLSVLDYAARARKAVPAFTPRGTIDYPQPPVSDAVRKASKRMSADAQQAALAARQASARTYAARMTQAIERERAEEESRQQAMVNAGVTETPEEAARATAAVEARIAVYERERRRALADAGLNPDGTLSNQAANASEARGTTVAWRVASRGLRAIRLEPTPETRPAFVRRLVLIDRGARGGTLRAFGEPMLDGRRETINGIAIRFAHKKRDRYEGPLTLTQVREMRA